MPSWHTILHVITYETTNPNPKCKMDSSHLLYVHVPATPLHHVNSLQHNMAPLHLCTRKEIGLRFHDSFAFESGSSPNGPSHLVWQWSLHPALLMRLMHRHFYDHSVLSFGVESCFDICLFQHAYDCRTVPPIFVLKHQRSVRGQRSEVSKRGSTYMQINLSS